MTKPILSYFDFPGSRGEECRLAFVLAGVDFEDDRIKSADWPDRKAQMPFGHVPILTLGDKAPLPECNAILRYIARTYGLELTDPWEQAHCDALMEVAEDMRATIWRALRSGVTEEEKKAARLELAQGELSAWAQAMEERILGPFAFGEKPTILDIKLLMIRTWVTSGVIDHLPTNTLDGCPKLAALSESLLGIPAISEFRARHAKPTV
jgi:glutathione S-transferase